MRRVLKTISNRTWKPFLQWYLRSPRKFKYKDISLVISPGVFHPGFFFSTKLLLSVIENEKLDGKNFLEMGCGSGLIGIAAAKKNATVTACDIASSAVACTKKNIAANKLNFSVIQSDLFTDLPPQQFDFIAVNPPYYKKSPLTPEEHAWYCGEHLEYFQKFFVQAKSFVSHHSKIIMVLSDECDINGIHSLAENFGWEWKLILKKKNAWETGFVFNICLPKEIA